ncbi:hypothetical protein [Arthrobacter sp. HMWF013]|uniref:hypothetical protein n=1 Tax=Arthrobacter sp. HMWF013 TaxID=2056849 RepID=UPI0015E80208|nr:hypothetical protein [Arthrobacter sp. HMWF013]
MVALLQAPAPVINNPVAVEGESSLTLTPVEVEPAADAQAISEEAISRAPTSSSSVSPSPSPSPSANNVIEASSVNSVEGFNALPIVFLAGLGGVFVGAFFAFQKWRSKRL